ncbi:TerB family tellurite resistance protein [Gammaproteobacteria bacterium]|nr:TerB family tellurite resistance protein [Gammaproteobacteria bacterium]
MTVLMTLAARVALKDGHVDDTEKAVLTSHLGLEKDKFAVSNAMFEEASKLPITEDELVKLLIGIYPDIEERRKVIDFLMQIALADGEYHSNEQEYLEDLSRMLLK